MSDLIPRSVLFGNPERSSASISPDGRRLAYLAPVGDVMNVWVGEPGGEFRPVTNVTDRSIRQYFWAEDNAHLVYLKDTGGDENWRIFVLDLARGEVHDATPFDEVQARVIGSSRRRPTELIVALNRENPQLHDPFLLDLESGELTQLETNPGFADWLVDEDLKIRGGMRFQADGSAEVVVDGRVVMTIPSDDALSSAPLGFTADGGGLYAVSSIGRNAAALVRLDLDSGDTEVIAADPTSDVHAVEIHPETREVQIVTFERARLEHLVLDQSLEADVEAMRTAAEGDLVFTGRDASDRYWVTAYTADDGPISYRLFDRETRESTFLFDHQPRLSEHTLVSMQPFTYTARDGLEIQGYVTLPADAGGPAATVLNVHGGPWARDSWGFDAEAQWFADRGYVCVQVNYRGSTGYGKEFLNAADKQWGAAMQDDLTDAVAHAVAEGWADPERVAIYGGSYGGYAALAGATFTPDLYRCAIDIVGPSSLLTLIETIPPYWKPLLDQFTRRVGDPETDHDMLWERSPLSRVDAIRIPMLIAQGANDPRVKQAESEQIVEAMSQKGIPHTYLLFPDEGHGFSRPENRMRFYAAAERFLAEHLGGRYEPEEPAGS